MPSAAFAPFLAPDLAAWLATLRPELIFAGSRGKALRRRSAWATRTSSSARSRTLLPSRRATPCSVTTVSASSRGIDTICPSGKRGTIVETFPPLAAEGISVTARPRFDRKAPQWRASCPPSPLYTFGPRA